MEIIHLLIVFNQSLFHAGSTELIDSRSNKTEDFNWHYWKDSIKLEAVFADWQLLDGLSCK